MWRKDDNERYRQVGAVAAGRHGVITTALLRAVGLSSATITRWQGAGLLHCKYRGVYAVGHPRLSLEGEWQAAVDACGLGAVLSHLAAACLWKFLKWDERWPIDVTVPISSGHRNNKAGIRLHRSRTMSQRSAVERSGIPVTNVPRILRDLPRVATPAQVRQVTRQAEIAGFRSAVPAEHVPNRSDLELAMHGLSKRHRLPIPRTRARIGRYEADFLFDDWLIIETDGWETHGTRQAFEDDRERDVELALLGYTTHRITWRQIMHRPAWVASVLRRLLAAK